MHIFTTAFSEEVVLGDVNNNSNIAKTVIKMFFFYIKKLYSKLLLVNIDADFRNFAEFQSDRVKIQFFTGLSPNIMSESKNY